MAVTAATGQQYGAATAQRAAQRALPMGPPPAPATAPPAGPAGPGAATAPGPASPGPGAVVPLSAPSMRPNEPVTAGLPVGPGAGVEVNPFNNVGSPDDAALALRAAYSAYPSEELRAILERIDLDG